ncbi:MAG: hypothetical protein P8X96_22320 [Desulfobacteraceae bacterium]
MQRSKPPYFKGELLADLVDMDSPQAVLDEVLFIMTLVSPQMDPARLTNAFSFMVSLYQGQWPGERECNTQFHDLRHITDTVMAMARLIHGAVLTGRRLGHRDILVGMVGALTHDAGYIQDKTDEDGTGAKYTTVHVKRSMDFIERYGRRFGLASREIPECQIMIQCTDLETDVTSIRFPSTNVELLAKLLGCADLIGQMADRIYLEKLFYLFREFKEGQVKAYADEWDLLNKTLAFFPMVEKRVKEQLGGYDALAQPHFRRRWGISENLYRVAIDRQHQYLSYILSQPDKDLSKFLRRKNIVQKMLRR